MKIRQIIITEDNEIVKEMYQYGIDNLAKKINITQPQLSMAIADKTTIPYGKYMKIKKILENSKPEKDYDK